MLGLGSFAVLVASDRTGVVPAPIRPLPYCVRRSDYCEGFIETCKRLSGLQKGNGAQSEHRVWIGVAQPPSAGGWPISYGGGGGDD